MTVSAVPAQALEYGLPPWLVCSDNKEAAEVGARYMPLEPANGATVPGGTPVTFSGESTHALTFNVASSEALVSSPDIDTGVGSQLGAFYRFTSTKAAAMPRTVYWTASFTFTPGDCESPSTFTTPVRTLVVAPSKRNWRPQSASRKKRPPRKTRKKKPLPSRKSRKKKSRGHRQRIAGRVHDRRSEQRCGSPQADLHRHRYMRRQAEPHGQSTPREGQACEGEDGDPGDGRLLDPGG
jgi:hypothetical protein